VVKEIKEVIDKYGIKQFRIVDDAFTEDRVRVIAFCNAVKDLGCYFNTILRADSVDKRLLKKMYEAGVREISIGVESGSPEILKKINKKETIEDIEKCIKKAKDVGLLTKVFLIFGLPGETLETIEETKAFMKKTKPDKYTMSTFIPLPGSDIYKNPDKYGTKLLKSAQELEDFFFYYEPDEDRGFHIEHKNMDELKKARGEMIEWLRAGEWK